MDPGTSRRMVEVCEDIKTNVAEIILLWDRRLQDQPWFSLPAAHRIDSLPEVVVGLVEASLCRPADPAAHRQQVLAAAEHGQHRRTQQFPMNLLFTEYHLLRQAMWEYLEDRYGPSDLTARAIMRIDAAITLATNASVLGYHRPELEATDRWEANVERLTGSSPFLR